MALTGGKHVMLSYNHKSKNVVKLVYDTLLTENIPVWFDDRDMDDDMYDSIAQAVADAAIVCCFMTPDYENSKNCKLELQHAQTLGKRIIPCMVSNRKVWKASTSSWLGLITSSILAVDFSDTSEASIRAKAQELIDKLKNQQSTYISPKLKWFEPIRQTYLTDSKIRRVMDNGEYPIENSYINLAMVETKEQHEKERKLKHNEGILSTYEEIYGVKNSIDVKDIFGQCKDQTRKVLVLGRAGIGKSTFCQYVTYLWAKGELWQEYELVILIILRKLTSDRYPSKTPYNYVDIVEREYFSQDRLSEGEKDAFRKQCQESKVLWILDGYDEFVQSKPTPLVDMFDYVHKKQHHILTSRPYSVDLSYDIKMEIIGFTDENIVNYAEEFFNQMKDETENTAGQSEKLLTFLQSNPNIWGIAHIPVNLELICTMWIDRESSKTDSFTVTQLYSEITEWFCIRYLEKQKNMEPKIIQAMTRRIVHKHCQTEMLFFEHLAYKAMGENQIMIQSNLVEDVQVETNCNLVDNPQLLNMGILKSYEETIASRKKQISKQHYFIHLSFQEYFTARHLLKLLMGPSRNDGINFIKENKYNQRFHFVFIFATGLLAETDFQAANNLYWETIEGEPLDLIGLKHTKFMIERMDQLIESKAYSQRSLQIQNVCDSIRLYCSKNKRTYTWKLADSLQRATAFINTTVIQTTLQRLLETNDDIACRNVITILESASIEHPTSTLVDKVLSFMPQNEALKALRIFALAKLGEKAATSGVLSALLGALRDANSYVRGNAAEALGKLGEKAATSEVISALLGTLRDKNGYVRRSAAFALGKFGEKAAASEVISALLGALRDKNEYVRRTAAFPLGKLGEKLAASEVISGLLRALRDEDEYVRFHAAEALVKLGEKAATSEVISGLLGVFRDENEYVRSHAAEALVKLGEKAATSEVICALLAALRDEDRHVRRNAAFALGKLGEKSATSEVVSALLVALRDEDSHVGSNAAVALGKLGEKAAANEVIPALSGALGDEDEDIRRSAAFALGKLGEKVGTGEVISALLAALRDEDGHVRRNAAFGLGKLGGKVATSEVISGLLALLGDEDRHVSSNAAVALGKLGEKAAANEVVSALSDALGDEDEYVRFHAAEVLGRLGEKAATIEVISAVSTALRDENEYVRFHAAEALVKLGEKAATSEVICALLAALRDEDVHVRRNAAFALGKLGEKAATSEVVSALLAALRDEDSHVGSNAAVALGKLGEKAAASEVISALSGALGDEDEDFRRSAAFALGKLGEKVGTGEVISALLAALRDEDGHVRRNAAFGLGKLGGKVATSEVISGLLALLGDEDRHVSSNAAVALGKLGEKAVGSEVISALSGALGDVDEYVRFHAAEVLGRLGEKAATSECLEVLLNHYCENGCFNDRNLNKVLQLGLLSYDVLKQLNPDLISKLYRYVEEVEEVFKGIVALDKCLRLFFDTGNDGWLHASYFVALTESIAVVVSDGCIRFYDGSGAREVQCPQSILIEAFVYKFGLLKQNFLDTDE